LRRNAVDLLYQMLHILKGMTNYKKRFRKEKFKPKAE
jgi:hypothetical protein